jgi:hypothetical protein
MTALTVRRLRTRSEQDGSAVVIAVALATVVLIVMGMASGRVLSTTSGATGLLQREQARTIAEERLMLTLAALDAGGADAAVRSGGAVDHTVQFDLVPDTDAGRPGGSVTVAVMSTADRGHDARQGLHVTITVDIGTARHVASATVRPVISIDHLLHSEFEVVDPVLRGRSRASCAATRSEGELAPGCLDTVVGPGQFDGPVHSNDAIVLAPGTTFASTLTTSHLTATADGGIGPALWGEDVAHAPGAAPFGLLHRSELTLPRHTRDVLQGATVTCRLRGPTLLRFDGPRVRITSPRSVPRSGDDATGGTASTEAIGCLGVDRAALAGVVVVELPPQAIIEVVRDPLMDCVDHPLGLATGEDTERDWWCNGGDAFVWGRYQQARTVAAEDNIQIVWDLEPGDASGPQLAGETDLLGLVAGDSIVLRRPVGRPIRRTAPFGLNLAFAGAHEPPFGGYPLDAPNETAVTWDSPRIVAALSALRGSVTLQNPFRGEPHPGPLRFSGSQASRFRGVLAWEERNSSGTLIGTMGYPVEWSYDRRFASSGPPAMPLTGDGTIRILELDVG